jgi:flagellin-specific chaperone FliS
MDASMTKSSIQEYEDKHGFDDEPMQTNMVYPEIIPLLQRIRLFLEDGEFDRTDEYCERVLDIEPTNAMLILGKHSNMSTT